MFRDWQPWKMKFIYPPDTHHINSCKRLPPTPPAAVALSSDLWDRSVTERRFHFLACSALGLALGWCLWAVETLHSGTQVVGRLSLGCKRGRLSESYSVASNHSRFVLTCSFNKPISLFPEPCASPW